MMSWYTFAIIALFCYGIQNFLYKVSAELKCNTAWTAVSFTGTVALLSGILFIALKESVTDIYFLLFISFLNATTFLTSTIAKIEALKHIDTSVVYPIARLNTVLVVIFSIIYFKDRFSLAQAIGIILAIVVILILTMKDKKDKEEKVAAKKFGLGIGIILTSIALVFGAASMIVCKFAAITVNTLGYISVSYLYNIFFSLGLRKRLQTDRENPKHKNALILGIFIGVFNFAGFYILLKAFSTGPLSIIASISSLSFVIVIALSVLIYREKLTLWRIIGILLAILAVVLLRI